MNNAATEQPMPTPEEDSNISSVQEIMGYRYGDGASEKVIDDALLRANMAKTKYKLEKTGCFAFNGRDAILDAYQEIVDALVYLTQYDMERRILKKEDFLPPFFQVTLLGMAMTLRDHLVEQGNFE